MFLIKWLVLPALVVGVAGGAAPGQLEVKTFDQNVALSNQIAFTVDVP